MTDPSTPTPFSNGHSGDNSRADGSMKNDSETGAVQPLITPRRPSRISWIWLVPLVAALVGLSLVVKTWLHTGPVVTISFESAAGLEVGQTKVRYKDVVIGTVTDIRVAPDRSNVLVKAELNRDGSAYITQEGTRFWVVRPRLGISGVSGLGTLISGAYISVDAPNSKEHGPTTYDFVGLEKPPEITSDRPGTRFVLNAPELGSLDIGSPIYYRRIQVGRVIGYDLNPDGRSVDVQIFIDAPNDKFVTSDARFWNSSGINLSLGADGVSVKTSSLASIIAGGIAFASADEDNIKPADANSTFVLRNTEAEAMADPDGPPFRVDMVFQQSVRGLKVGAPVDFRGLELGKVVDIDLEFDPKDRRFFVLVKTHLFPLRFGEAYKKMSELDSNSARPGEALLGPLVKHGLRAQIRASNLLTGQQYIALDFFPDAPSVEFDSKQAPILLPTIAGSFDRLQQQISNIVAKIDAIPLDGISEELRGSLKSVTQLVNRMSSQVAPQATATLKAAQRSLDRVDKLLAQDSPMNDNLDRTLRELSSAAKSLRALGDYLQTHPTAVIRGRGADVLPPVSP